MGIFASVSRMGTTLEAIVVTNVGPVVVAQATPVEMAD